MATKSVNINIPAPQVEIKLVGDWAKAINLPQQVVKAIAEGYADATASCSKDIIRIVRRAIKTGLPPEGSGVTWQPLSPLTIKAHGQHAIYNMTGFYENSIGVHTYKNRVLVGIPINVRTPGGLTINQLAKLLEFGSKGKGNIPSRPLWAPSLASYGGTKKIKKVVIRNIRKAIVKNTGIDPKEITTSW